MRAGVIMHRARYLFVDLLLIVLASLIALALRENFDFSNISPDRARALAGYLCLTLLTALVVLPALGVTRSVWRFTGLRDYLTLAAATIMIVAGATALGFAATRLENVARSLPVLEGMVMLTLLVGARILVRLRHLARAKPAQLSAAVAHDDSETILVVGINKLTELFLQSVQEFAADRVTIAGLLGRSERHTGRLVHRYKVLGTPEQIADIIRDLEPHGIVVDRVVVTVPLARLSPEAQQALLDLESASNIRLDILATTLGLEKPNAESEASSSGDARFFSFSDTQLSALASRPYWRGKRILDATLALALLILFAPVMVLVALLVAIDVGLPIVFWQQRPGLGGQPYKLFKFRTMAEAHTARGWRIPDAKRTSRIGRALRRARLDELPQLVHILLGEMSFVGPRPLLPVDQPAAYAARLLVRPGLTGWAQVMGGREISASDKAALDVWYVQNASFALDLQILLRTLRMVILGERVNAAAIQRAWQGLELAGVCQGVAPHETRDAIGGASSCAPMALAS